MDNKKLKVDGDYGAEQIKVLDPVESVRTRPGMYIGSTSQSGINQLFYEIIDNSLDEFVAGYGKEIFIKINKDCSVEVQDQGRGIPVGPHPVEKNKDGTPKDTLTVILTSLHSGSKFGGAQSGYKCFTEDSKVNTEYGLKPIKDIEPGKDKVFNACNELSPVLNKFEYEYNDNINCVELEDGRIIRAIDGHRLLVSNNGSLVWKKINELTEEDCLVEIEKDDDIEELIKIIPENKEIKFTKRY